MTSAVAISPANRWDGIDGNWSSFNVGIGQPAQRIRALVSFKAYQTWAVVPEGCASAADVGSCQQARGGVYDSSKSSSYRSVGIFELGVDDALGYTGNAEFGYDAVALPSAVKVANTTVAGYALDNFYQGMIGLNPKPTNFTSKDQSPSFMTLLKRQGSIASLSAAYTAGAHYRSGGEYAALTLGGYDAAQAVANNVSFSLTDGEVVVGIQNITTPSVISDSPHATELLPDPMTAVLDPTVPHLWLPREACQAFEIVFGIVHDQVTDLYLVNTTQHAKLSRQNPNITFTLSPGLQSGPTVDVVLPYAAFDLTAGAGYRDLTNDTLYFPLRRANDSTQYTLGRTFFQEAYVSVNWEAQQFNVSQRNWNQNVPSQLVTIPPGDHVPINITGQAHTPHGLSKGAIAGIVIGVLAALAIPILSLLCLRRRRNRRRRAREAAQRKASKEASIAKETEYEQSEDGLVFPKAELDGAFTEPGTPVTACMTPVTPYAPSSIGNRGHWCRSSDAESPRTPTVGEGTYSSSTTVTNPFTPTVSEADGKERHIYEMPGDMPDIWEKDGKSLSEKEAMQFREMKYNGVPEPRRAFSFEGKPGEK
ncbi:acid protease [Piedraia hortae CBS 480.64]|uniref:Acid protease n=1 Tax=Piedraia hortae CBS 480.64 TaxID=1314780 RepID=A0A6A7C1C9_9PEZI|nr:acid protease [Piedraia hortae CBS 480.64]